MQFMVRSVWLVGALSLIGCYVEPAYVGPPPPRYAQVCRNPATVLVRLNNPGPDSVAVGRTLVSPGWTALCIPAGARRLVAVALAPQGPGQPFAPVITADGRGVIGHPIAIIGRGPRSTTATVDMRYAVALPMAYASVAAGAAPLPGGPGPAAAPPPAAPPGAPPAAAPPPPPAAPPPYGSPAPPPSDPNADQGGETDSLWNAFQGVEAPQDGNAKQ